MRDALAATPGEPIASFRDGLLFILRLRLVVDGRIAQSGSHRIDHGFQQSDQCGDLRLRQALNQLVSLLAGVGHRSPPKS
jgi:hypothetical protein